MRICLFVCTHKNKKRAAEAALSVDEKLIIIFADKFNALFCVQHEAIIPDPRCRGLDDLVRLFLKMDKPAVLSPHAIFRQGITGTDPGIVHVVKPEGCSIGMASVWTAFPQSGSASKPELSKTKDIIQILVIPKETYIFPSKTQKDILEDKHIGI